jgi:virginiamycin B lyase
MDLRTHRVDEFKVSYGTAPASIAAAPDGSVWFSEAFHQVGRIDTAGKIAEFSMADDRRSPLVMTLGPDGNMWFGAYRFVGDGGSTAGSIGRIDNAGKIVEVADGLPAGSFPDSLAVGGDGNLWFTDYYGNRIGKLQLH